MSITATLEGVNKKAKGHSSLKKLPHYLSVWYKAHHHIIRARINMRFVMNNQQESTDALDQVNLITQRQNW